jgi:hypothetical protein
VVYSWFSWLDFFYIYINILVLRQNFPLVCSAVRVLCEGLVARLPLVLKGSHSILTIKTYINAIQVSVGYY